MLLDGFRRPRLDRIENTAQLIALIMIKKSPGVTKIAVKKNGYLPLLTTNRTPIIANRIPEI